MRNAAAHAGFMTNSSTGSSPCIAVRRASNMTTRSSPIRREAKVSAERVSLSIHCRSSTITTSGRRRACSDSRDSVAAAMRNRSAGAGRTGRASSPVRPAGPPAGRRRGPAGASADRRGPRARATAPPRRRRLAGRRQRVLTSVRRPQRRRAAWSCPRPPRPRGTRRNRGRRPPWRLDRAGPRAPRPGRQAQPNATRRIARISDAAPPFPGARAGSSTTAPLRRELITCTARARPRAGARRDSARRICRRASAGAAQAGLGQGSAPFRTADTAPTKSDHAARCSANAPRPLSVRRYDRRRRPPTSHHSLLSNPAAANRCSAG